MARNKELIRQWDILREIDRARTGVTIGTLAASQSVHQRTIRRDIDALCRAGFPLYDDKVNGTAMWKLGANPFRSLEETGLGIAELCALYLGRSMLTASAGGLFRDDVDRAFAKLERSLPAGSRKYLDAIETLVRSKTNGRKKQDGRRSREIIARAVDASLTRRRALMRYASASSNRTKDYTIEALRICYADGGVYLTAFVPEYAETRTFAVERILTFRLLDDHFDPRPLPPEPFANSLGVHSGQPELIEVEFDRTVADYVRGREWHRSQEIADHPDGSLLMRLCVSDDPSLRRWILSFGSAARVIWPRRLAREVYEELQRAGEGYAPRLKFEMLRMRVPGTDEHARIAR